MNIRKQIEDEGMTAEAAVEFLIGECDKKEAEVVGLVSAIQAMGEELNQVKEDREGLLAWKRNVDEALNSGDGSYRP